MNQAGGIGFECARTGQFPLLRSHRRHFDRRAFRLGVCPFSTWPVGSAAGPLNSLPWIPERWSGHLAVARSGTPLALAPPPPPKHQPRPAGLRRPHPVCRLALQASPKDCRARLGFPSLAHWFFPVKRWTRDGRSATEPLAFPGHSPVLRTREMPAERPPRHRLALSATRKTLASRLAGDGCPKARPCQNGSVTGLAHFAQPPLFVGRLCGRLGKRPAGSSVPARHAALHGRTSKSAGADCASRPERPRARWAARTTPSRLGPAAVFPPPLNAPASILNRLA